jgi:hypothetical protein
MIFSHTSVHNSKFKSTKNYDNKCDASAYIFIIVKTNCLHLEFVNSIKQNLKV